MRDVIENTKESVIDGMRCVPQLYVCVISMFAPTAGIEEIYT